MFNLTLVLDSTGQTRDIFIRYVREHAVENNEWGDFQTHRRLLGLITVGKFESQGELNEVSFGVPRGVFICNHVILMDKTKIKLESF